jgi:hypothetical protein
MWKAHSARSSRSAIPSSEASLWVSI